MEMLRIYSLVFEPSYLYYFAHLNKAVENYLWGTAEIAVGVAEAVRGDPLGGALLVAEGIRNCKEAWNELQEAIAEKEEKTPRK